MKFTNKKRGFTIVELIIVIAVIAVLAAVLIPVFSGLIQQGKDAEAKVVVNTLNKGLAMTTTKPATMQSALEAVETNVGINVAKLDETYAKTGNKILWDSEYNTFLFVTKSGDKVSAPNVDKFTNNEINLWAVAKTTDDLKDNYSHYWYGGDVAAVEVATGFDAGEASINAITYKTDAAQSVVIRTNSEKTELTINAKNSDVKHYDVAGNVKVLAVKGASYHEYGNVIGTVTVESGHVQIESGAEVASVIASKSASETVAASVTATSGATVGTVVVNNASASVEVKSGATVAEVAPGKGVTIDTSKVTGITPSTTVIDTEKASDFAGGLGTEASPYLIATAEQFVKIGDLNDQMKDGKAFGFKLIDNIDLSSITFANDYVSSYFCGSLNAINENSGCYSLTVNDSLTGIFGVAVKNTTFSNIELKLFTNPVKLCYCTDVATKVNLRFSNVTISTVTDGDYVKIGKNEGLYFNQPGYDAVTNNWCDNYRNTITFENCNAYANITAESYNAVYIGGMLNNTDATVAESTYYGQYYGEYVNLVYGNICSDNSWELYGKSTMTIKNVSNKGAIYGTERAGLIAGGAGKTEASLHTTITNCNIGTTRALSDASLAVSIDANKNVVVNKATASVDSYVVTFVGGIRRIGEFAENSAYRFSIKIESPEFDSNGKMTTDLKIGKFVTTEQFKLIQSDASFEKGTGKSVLNENGAEYWIKEVDGVTYYVFAYENSYFHFESSKGQSGPADINSVLITVYDAENKPIAQKSCKAK